MRQAPIPVCVVPHSRSWCRRTEAQAGDTIPSSRTTDRQTTLARHDSTRLVDTVNSALAVSAHVKSRLL